MLIDLAGVGASGAAVLVALWVFSRLGAMLAEQRDAGRRTAERAAQDERDAARREFQQVAARVALSYSDILGEVYRPQAAEVPANVCRYCGGALDRPHCGGPQA